MGQLKFSVDGWNIKIDLTVEKIPFATPEGILDLQTAGLGLVANDLAIAQLAQLTSAVLGLEANDLSLVVATALQPAVAGLAANDLQFAQERTLTSALANLTANDLLLLATAELTVQPATAGLAANDLVLEAGAELLPQPAVAGLVANDLILEEPSGDTYFVDDFGTDLLVALSPLKLSASVTSPFTIKDFTSLNTEVINFAASSPNAEPDNVQLDAFVTAAQESGPIIFVDQSGTGRDGMPRDDGAAARMYDGSAFYAAPNGKRVVLFNQNLNNQSYDTVPIQEPDGPGFTVFSIYWDYDITGFTRRDGPHAVYYANGDPETTNNWFNFAYVSNSLNRTEVRQGGTNSVYPSNLVGGSGLPVPALGSTPYVNCVVYDPAGEIRIYYDAVLVDTYSTVTFNDIGFYQAYWGRSENNRGIFAKSCEFFVYKGVLSDQTITDITADRLAQWT